MEDMWEVPGIELEAALAKAKARKPKNRRRAPTGERFVMRIPMSWLMSAKDLGFAAYHVGVVGWHLFGMNKWKPFRYTNEASLTFGINRHAKSKGLAALEAAGLVIVDRKNKHSSPRVEMLYTPDTT